MDWTDDKRGPPHRSCFSPRGSRERCCPSRPGPRGPRRTRAESRRCRCSLPWRPRGGLIAAARPASYQHMKREAGQGGSVRVARVACEEAGRLAWARDRTSSSGAPRMARSRTTSSRPRLAAALMGDQPPLLQRQGFAPRSRSAATTLGCPPSRAAKTRGVSPCLFSASTGAPASSRRVTTVALPGRQPMHARCRGVPHSSEQTAETRSVGEGSASPLLGGCDLRYLSRHTRQQRQQ